MSEINNEVFNNEVEQNEIVSSEIVEASNTSEAVPEQEMVKEDKTEKRPSSIELKDKSDLFKRIMDIALEVEKKEEDKKKTKEKNKKLSSDNDTLKAELKQVKAELEKYKEECELKQAEIEGLKSDVDHRNSVIDIVKADKSESSQEFKNSLAAALKTFKADYLELSAMEMSDEVGPALADTLSAVFKTLERNDIIVR